MSSVYIGVGRGDAGDSAASLVIDARTDGFARTFNVKITQIPCDSPVRWELITN